MVAGLTSRRVTLWSVCAALALASSTAQAREEVPNAESTVAPKALSWAAVLAKAVSADGLKVDYAVVVAHRAALNAFLASVASASLPREKAPKIAFVANAYNALVVDGVLRHGLAPKSPGAEKAKTVLDVKGFFDGEAHTVAGQSLTLNALEALIRPLDSRTHFAVNCASADCPGLRQQLWRAETLEADLDVAARAFLARPEQLMVTEAGMKTSQIFEWYAADFGGVAGVRAFLQRYGGPRGKAVTSTTALAYREYRWVLNAK